MTLPRFVQIHTLHSYPAALLNRDDAGLAKRIPFGGVERIRISSQCLKRHWRMADDAHALARIDPAIGRSVRSRHVWTAEIEQPLLAEGYTKEPVRLVLKAMQDALYDVSDKAKAEKKAATKDVGLARKEVVVLGRKEIEYLKAEARRIAATAGTDEKVITADLKGLRANLRALVAGAGIDAAMFGRFVSGDPKARVDAAVHVAHAFTVNAAATEADYFTAVDDLAPEDEGAGAGHLNATELTSGVYYGYVVIDLPLLVSNLEGCARADWHAADRTLAARAVAHLLHLVAKVTPGAKLGSTAPYDYASLILVETGDAQPRSLANAFLRPVKGNPLDAEAATILSHHLGEIDAMYGADGKRRLATRFAGLEVPQAERATFPKLVGTLEAELQA